MKLALILPRCMDRTEDNKDRLFLPPLNLPTIAAATPEDVDVTILDDRIQAIDYDERYDLVGITCITETALRAYEIADNFRKRGVKVILGGLHPTLCKDDAKPHADSVFSGEALGAKWKEVIDDCRNGELKPFYHNPVPGDLSIMPKPGLDLLPKSRKYMRSVRMVNATRGCYMKCTFCSTKEFWQGTFRGRPVENIVDEIRKSGKRYIAFVDDDIAGNRQYAIDLFKALRPLKVLWASQSRINLCLDEELLGLASQSGCMALFVGFESISADSLCAMRKHQNKTEDYLRAIGNCHKNNICIEAGFVFGFDNDDKAIFRDTRDFILSSGLDSINVNVLHPIPGTDAFRQLDAEGRISSYDWSKWSSVGKCLFKPKLMSPEELEAGAAWLLRQIYTWPLILKRTLRSIKWCKTPLAVFFALSQNVNYRARRAIPWGGGYDPANERFSIDPVREPLP